MPILQWYVQLGWARKHVDSSRIQIILGQNYFKKL